MANQVYSGSRIIPVRLPDEMLGQVAAAVVSANKSAFDEPYNMSSWIRECIKAKLNHLQRGKKSRARKKISSGNQA